MPYASRFECPAWFPFCPSVVQRNMTRFHRSALDAHLATPTVASVVTSLGVDGRDARAIRPWTHAGYTSWRRAALRAMPVALVLGGLLVAGARAGGSGIGVVVLPTLGIWIAAALVLARRWR